LIPSPYGGGGFVVAPTKVEGDSNLQLNQSSTSAIGVNNPELSAKFALAEE
ncbi:uncharacterized protein METZ01_LOCUS373675, partial [marine metagenome]